MKGALLGRRRFTAGALILVLGVAPAASAATFHYSLPGPGPLSASGTHWIALPVQITSPAILDCGDLLAHIPNVVELARFDPSTDTTVACTCPGAGCFPILAGQGYRVRVTSLSTFTLQGTDGSVAIPLVSQGAGSASGSQWISLPFGTPIINSAGLLADLGGPAPPAGSGPVILVGRYLTASDTIHVYTGTRGGLDNFPVVPGEATLIRVAADVVYTPPSYGGNFCDTPTTCNFQGLDNVATGNATLTLDEDTGTLLIVSNLGTSLDDGVDVFNPPDPTREGHEPWIELGAVSQQEIDNPSTPSGTSVKTTSFGTTNPAVRERGPGTRQFSLDFVEVAGDQIEIRPDFTAVSAAVTYQVYDLGHPVNGATGQTQPARASDWPTTEAFGLVRWASPVTITLPGRSPVTGNELHIIPESPNAVLQRAERLELRVPPPDPPAPPGLTTLTITQETFDSAEVIVGQPTASIPSLGGWGRIGLGLGLVASLGWALARRRRRDDLPPARPV